MKIAIGADHGGYSLKEIVKKHLTEQGHEVLDLGTHDTQSCHYPVFAEKVAHAVASGECERGILCCGTGIGMLSFHQVRLSLPWWISPPPLAAGHCS